MWVGVGVVMWCRWGSDTARITAISEGFLVNHHAAIHAWLPFFHAYLTFFSRWTTASRHMQCQQKLRLEVGR